MNKEIFTPYVEQIFEDFPNLHFIAFKKDAVLAYNEKTNKAHFFYDVSEYAGCEMSFHFNLLCECNDSSASWFSEMIKKLHFKLETKETASDFFDTLTPIKKSSSERLIDLLNSL